MNVCPSCGAEMRTRVNRLTVHIPYDIGVTRDQEAIDEYIDDYHERVAKQTSKDAMLLCDCGECVSFEKFNKKWGG